MDSPTRPLSPSRAANATLGAPTPRKKVILEQEDGFDDFFAAAALAEAEQEEEQQPPSSPVRRVGASSSTPRRAAVAAKTMGQEDTEIISRPGVKEGKRRLVLEPEDGFGDGMDLEGAFVAGCRASSPSLTSSDRCNSTSSWSSSSDSSSTRLHLSIRQPARPQPQFATGRDRSCFYWRYNSRRQEDHLRSPQEDRELAGFNRSEGSSRSLGAELALTSLLTLQKEDSDALAKLAGSMLEVPYGRMVEEIENATLLAQKQAKADA